MLMLEELELRTAPAGISPAAQVLIAQAQAVIAADQQAIALVQANFGGPGASFAQQLAGLIATSLIQQQVAQQFDTLLTDLAQLAISGD
jgi:hypothetical protein